jgi:SAM-dependent methyltransferase
VIDGSSPSSPSAGTNHPAQAFDAYAESYDAALEKGLAVSGERKAYFADGRMRFLRNRLNDLQRSATSVLDYGCGDGTTTPLFYDILGAVSVTGVDTSAGLLARARSQFGSDSTHFHLVGDLEPEPRFALAFCNGVFHHIPPADRVAAARYVYDSLAPGAVFGFWENNPWNPGTRWVMSRIPFDRDAITIPPPEGRHLLRQSGFEIITTAFLFLFPRYLGWFRPLERFFTPVPLGAQYLVLAQKPAA